MDATRLRGQGRRAFERVERREAYEHLSAAAADDAPLEPEDLERLAVPAYLTGRDGESTRAWIRAHQAWLDGGGYGPAVRCAFWAGFGLLQRGEPAQGGGDLERGTALFGEAGRLAQRFGDRDLAALGTVGRAQASLRSGSLPEGMRLLDEAMVSVSAGETSPLVSGVVYCAVIDACQQVFAAPARRGPAGRRCRRARGGPRRRR